MSKRKKNEKKIFKKAKEARQNTSRKVMNGK